MVLIYASAMGLTKILQECGAEAKHGHWVRYLFLITFRYGIAAIRESLRTTNGTIYAAAYTPYRAHGVHGFRQNNDRQLAVEETRLAISGC
jgi:hypothetical protein